ncbi:uncharacterized protein [Spinacia oleracea]|uniref:DUF4218 domain-containing protein n=1 Tax=Spinacia oleracea TaxID=3562 RepID=A0ABM3RR51_SPIOL|nr:uncharacterized protein LOC110804590 [Spinacia oleracea]
MSHPSDGEAWKHLDKEYESFAAEPRNVRLGLCTDGFSPFGKTGRQYSCWPVILTPYNLPPSLCMKKPFVFLSLIIPGPKSPKGNLDVFLQPLIEELKQVWEVGLPTYDISKKQNFQMKVALLWTISDFLAYGMLSGWSTAGRLSCPYFMEKTKAFTLTNGGKQSWFDCHRPFLPRDHAFRKNKSAFRKDTVENSSPPPRLSGKEVWNRVSLSPTTLECIRDEVDRPEGFGVLHHFTKQSVFWELPYWRKLLIRHNLDVMHIEKNVFDNVFHTVMDVKGKTKDNVKERRDLKVYCKRRKLEARDIVNSKGKEVTIMPNAPFVLPKDKRKLVCEWVNKLKFPDGYALNLGYCVDLKDCKLFGMKSHDCHVFMQRLLPVVFKDLLPLNEWNVITELSQFFRDLCSTTLKVDHMERLEDNIPEILCKLERIFPPGFFNSMEHLPIHLPYEAKVGGPVQYRWMYPFERFIYHLKKKVGNKARVEGSICNAYLLEEITNFCSLYFEEDVNCKVKDLGLGTCVDNESNIDPDLPEMFSSIIGHSSSEGQFCYLDEKDYKVAHRYVLSNCEILQQYQRDYVLKKGINTDIIRSLASGPLTRVRKFNRYHINGYHFHTFAYGKNKSTMNYGVCVKSVKGDDFYGILQEVVELTYVGARKRHTTVLFKCDWFDVGRGTRIHEKYNLVVVNHSKRYPKYDPFVLAYQVEQVYYAPSPANNIERNQWWFVFDVKARGIIDAPIDPMAFQLLANENPSLLSEFQDEEFVESDEENQVLSSHEYVEVD